MWCDRNLLMIARFFFFFLGGGGGGGGGIKTISIEFVDHTRIFVDIIYLYIFPCQQEHAKLCMKWLTLTWDFVFSFMQFTFGMSEYSTGKFVIMCNISGVTIGQKWTQYIDYCVWVGWGWGWGWGGGGDGGGRGVGGWGGGGRGVWGCVGG